MNSVVPYDACLLLSLIATKQFDPPPPPAPALCTRQQQRRFVDNIIIPSKIAALCVTFVCVPPMFDGYHRLSSPPPPPFKKKKKSHLSLYQTSVPIQPWCNLRSSGVFVLRFQDPFPLPSLPVCRLVTADSSQFF